MSLNGTNLVNGVVTPLPAAATGVNMQGYLNQGSGVMSVVGNTSNATMTFTIQWQPDPGKNLMTDPPPATVNAVVTLTRQQGYVLRTGIIAGELSLKATSELSADGVTFPAVQKELQ